MYKEESYTSVYQTISRKFAGKEKKERSFLFNFLSLYLKSLKPFYTEELIVFFLYRPLSFLLAYSVFKLPVSPNFITILRSIGGVTAGILFAQGNYESVALGAILLFISNIFDCSDGQLARMRGTSSWIGTTLDGIGDFTAVFSIYTGTAVGLSLSMPEVGAWWFLVCILALASLVVHISGFGLFRFEFINFTMERYPEDLKTLDEQKEEQRAARAAHAPPSSKLLIALQYVQVIPIEILSLIVFPKGYRGYKRWFKRTGARNEDAKKIFKANYKESNKRILQGFGSISTLSNLSVFIVAGLFGHLEWALFMIIFGFNTAFAILLAIQRWSFKKQLAIAGFDQ
jgi:hypothetical protein